MLSVQRATIHNSIVALLHAYHFFYNIETSNIFPQMEVFIESPAYIKSNKNLRANLWW